MSGLLAFLLFVGCSKGADSPKESSAPAPETARATLSQKIEAFEQDLRDSQRPLECRYEVESTRRGGELLTYRVQADCNHPSTFAHFDLRTSTFTGFLSRLAEMAQMNPGPSQSNLLAAYTSAINSLKTSAGDSKRRVLEEKNHPDVVALVRRVTDAGCQVEPAQIVCAPTTDIDIAEARKQALKALEDKLDLSVTLKWSFGPAFCTSHYRAVGAVQNQINQLNRTAAAQYPTVLASLETNYQIQLKLPDERYNSGSEIEAAKASFVRIYNNLNSAGRLDEAFRDRGYTILEANEFSARYYGTGYISQGTTYLSLEKPVDKMVLDLLAKATKAQVAEADASFLEARTFLYTLACTYHRSNDVFLDTRVSKIILNERANLVRGRRSYALFLEHKVADGDRTHDFGGYLSFKLFVDDTDERILEILKSYFRN